MTEKTVQIAIPLLLPDLPDERDQCIDRLQTLLQGRRGILWTHLELGSIPARLCIHYDPNLVSLATVQRMAEEAGSELRNGYIHERIPFSGLTSADAAQVLQDELERLPGMLHASVSYAAGLVFVGYEHHTLAREEIERVMRQLGARPVEVTALSQPGAVDQRAPGAAEDEHDHDHRGAPAFLPHWLRERWTMALAAAAGLLLLTAWAGVQLEWLSEAQALPLYLMAFIAGGYEPARHAVPSLLRGKFDTDVLMLAAAAGAAALGEWAEGAFLLFLFSLGHAGEHYALDRARSAINALGKLMPRTARVRRGEQIVEEPVEGLAVGDQVVVRPGDRVPVDGIVRQGASSVDQSPITGESAPVAKSFGDSVYAGTINQEAALDVQVTRLARDTTLSRVVQMVAEAQSQQSQTQQKTNRFTTWFVPSVLVLVVLTAAVPPLAGWMPFAESFYRAMLLLVAASPCALAIGTPAAVLAGIAQAARNGVLIKGGVHLENLGGLNVIAFDKTGTLTEGRFAVTDVETLNGTTPDEVLRLAGAVEQQSNHPLAQAVVLAAKERRLALPAAGSLENLPGRGVRSRVNGDEVLIGSLELFAQPGSRAVDGPAVRAAAEVVERLERGGRTTMVVSRGRELLGVVGLADTPRPGAKDVLARLAKLGLQKLVMLTGDNPAAARQAAAQVGVSDVRSGLLPEDKLAAIQALRQEHGAVAMIGDGVNDAPALASATVGIAMGGAGTAVALETADVVLLSDDLSRLPFAVGLSRASARIIRQNLVIALGVIAVLILTSVLGLLQLSWAVFFHEGSTVLVAVNALRLLAYQEG